MNENLLTSDYSTLSAHGLTLSEDDFTTIIVAVTQGIKDARVFLHNSEDSLPKISFSDDITIIGYSAAKGAINIRMDYLNLVATNTTPLAYRDQLVCFVPDKFYMILKYLHWLRLFGIEETIHYYQYHGNTHLTKRFPDVFPEGISPKTLLFSDYEVEARSIVDKIALVKNEQPVWKNLDAYFLSHYPKYYNKQLDYLAMLPKPDLPISFEMENLLS